jgi:hypothetical protein
MSNGTATRAMVSNVYNYRFSNLVPVILPAYITCEDGIGSVQLRPYRALRYVCYVCFVRYVCYVRYTKWPHWLRFVRDSIEK